MTRVSRARRANAPLLALREAQELDQRKRPERNPLLLVEPTITDRTQIIRLKDLLCKTPIIVGKKNAFELPAFDWFRFDAKAYRSFAQTDDSLRLEIPHIPGYAVRLRVKSEKLKHPFRWLEATRLSLDGGHRLDVSNALCTPRLQVSCANGEVVLEKGPITPANSWEQIAFGSIELVVRNHHVFADRFSPEIVRIMRRLEDKLQRITDAIPTLLDLYDFIAEKIKFGPVLTTSGKNHRHLGRSRDHSPGTILGYLEQGRQISTPFEVAMIGAVFAEYFNLGYVITRGRLMSADSSTRTIWTEIRFPGTREYRLFDPLMEHDQLTQTYCSYSRIPASWLPFDIRVSYWPISF
ncbi:hypothetical protein HY988_04290 [Candidatus Micrarchaeota archaeon]|nr:hypothetical protein [Candidatus Micrarchaeota archaeon]